VFDPFFTTKDPEEGGGLGLALSHGVIAEGGGSIWVEDSDLGGARVTAELPLDH
jgi:C4-dicarboxylate-specific signal transduction histidine kinase